jgi:hypothetical protein
MNTVEPRAAWPAILALGAALALGGCGGGAPANTAPAENAAAPPANTAGASATNAADQATVLTTAALVLRTWLYPGATWVDGRAKGPDGADMEPDATRLEALRTWMAAHEAADASLAGFLEDTQFEDRRVAAVAALVHPY